MIVAVRMFDGESANLEFFIKRMGLITDQMVRLPFDDASANFVLGFFYCRIAMNIILELGIAVDVNWGDVKTKLPEKFGVG